VRAAAVLVAALALAASAPAATGPLTASVDHTRISARLGEKLAFRSTITNHGRTAARGLIAHLNILSLRDGVYVDPEDWSTSRTRYLGAIAPGGSTTVTWRLRAVNAGTFGVYVAVLPRSGEARPPVTAPTIRLAVAARRSLNSGGVVPLALGVPGFLALLALGLRRRRRSG